MPLDINYPYLVTYKAALTYKHNYTDPYKGYNTRINSIIIKKMYRVYNT